MGVGTLETRKAATRGRIGNEEQEREKRSRLAGKEGLGELKNGVVDGGGGGGGTNERIPSSFHIFWLAHSTPDLRLTTPPWALALLLLDWIASLHRAEGPPTPDFIAQQLAQKVERRCPGPDFPFLAKEGPTGDVDGGHGGGRQEALKIHQANELAVRRAMTG
ncbi:hypothetical protein CKAH01_01205 [Colletotrichum kahawae]|uniref:Uncharacterized protein n=1 Tax=Colletotrichum kahawae TaxID=34407 RepID=A0AAD9YCJ6_COLKA|nr:hypothetical protein CKAH01_01205 [Colletotrichum kahawae]